MERLSSGFASTMQKMMQQGRVLQRVYLQKLWAWRWHHEMHPMLSYDRYSRGRIREVHNMLLRMREIAVQASNGTLTTADRTALNAEVTALGK